MRGNEAIGMVYAAAGFALLPVGDSLIKATGGSWPGTAVALARYAIAAAALCALLFLREGAGGFRALMAPVHVVRGLAVAVATGAFFSAVFLMPLVEVTLISFVNPIITAALAAPVLGEKTRKETWIAIMVAFIGVLIVLRPNFLAIGWPAVLPLLSASAFSVLLLANRAVTGRASVLAMQAYLAFWAVPFLALGALAGQASGVPALTISWQGWGVVMTCAAVAVTASTAHYLIYLGTTHASPAKVAPMSYAQLLMASLLGFLFFAETPDLTAIFGAAVIVGSGIYLWRAGRIREPVESE